MSNKTSNNSDNRQIISVSYESFEDNKTNKTILIRFGDEKLEYPYCWLRDNCDCSDCYNYDTKQRKIHMIEIPWNLNVQNIDKQDNKLKIQWQDDHESIYCLKFLYKNHFENWKKRQLVDRILWSGQDMPQDVAYIDKENFLNSEESLKEFLNSLVRYGVAFVDNVEPTMEDTERVISRVAPPQRTLFGDMWKFTSDLKRADTAYTNIPLAPHTDGTYLVESPGLQVLHCLEHSGTGGDTIALDGFYAADLLQKKNPSLYKVLMEEMQPATYEEDGWNQFHCDPVIKINKHTQQIRQIRYNVYDRTPHCISPHPVKIKNMHEALVEFGKICNSKHVEWTFKLNPGRVFFFDNWRVLHGRTGFTGHRVLGGSYVARGDWLSAARLRGLID